MLVSDQGLWEGVSAGTSVRGPAVQEGACESLKGHVTLVIDVLFWFFFLIDIFNYFYFIYLLSSSYQAIFTYKCYTSGVTRRIPEGFLKISIRVIKTTWTSNMHLYALDDYVCHCFA